MLRDHAQDVVAQALDVGKDLSLASLVQRGEGLAWFNSLGESVSLVTGLIFIACVLAFRRGIVGEMVARVKPLRASS